MRALVQKAVVRVIASELDRRSAALERAVIDAHTRMDQLTEQAAASAELAKSARSAAQNMLQSLGAAHERLAARVDELSERVRRGEDVDRAHLAELEQLRFDVRDAQAGLGDVTGVLERLTQSG